MSGNRSTSKKSADRRCLSRRLIPVFTEAAVMARRPVTLLSATASAEPSISVNTPLTCAKPQKVGLWKASSVRVGSSRQVPIQSSGSMVFSSARQQRSHIGRVEVLIDPGDAAVGSDLDHDAYPQLDGSTMGGVGVQHMLLDESAVEELSIEDLVPACRGDPQEPADHLQGQDPVVVGRVAAVPHRDVIGPQGF